MGTFTRRDFMKHSSVALAASTLAGTVSSGVVSANDKIIVGVVGVGGMGRGDLACFLHNDDVECAVVCDVDDKNIAEAVKVVEGNAARYQTQ